MKVLYLESFFGGSHQNFAQGLKNHSRHEIEIYGLPSRFWKWRARSSAFTFHKEVPTNSEYDLLFITDLICLSDFLALRGRQGPIILYMHENQLSYPVPQGERRDYHFALTDLYNAFLANRVLFNSHFHLESFKTEMKAFIKKMPDYQPRLEFEEVLKKSEVIYPGVDLQEGSISAETKTKEVTILWNHRWEFDKNPQDFFQVLYELSEEGLCFNLVVLGENFQEKPAIFLEAKERLSSHIIQFGYAKDRKSYELFLRECHVVVSTAIQENFGISVVEACACGCFPLLPMRLSYPEILPREFHKECLYRGKRDLKSRLRKILQEGVPENTPMIQERMKDHLWKHRAREYDHFFESLLNSFQDSHSLEI